MAGDRAADPWLTSSDTATMEASIGLPGHFTKSGQEPVKSARLQFKNQQKNVNVSVCRCLGIGIHPVRSVIRLLSLALCSAVAWQSAPAARASPSPSAQDRFCALVLPGDETPPNSSRPVVAAPSAP